jgi:hypothetical protein
VDGLTVSEVDVGGGEVVEAFVIAPIVVVGSEGSGLRGRAAVVVLEQDAIFSV